MNTSAHHHNHRLPQTLQVQIRYRNRRFPAATGRYISAEAMFIDLRNLTLPPGTFIELEFRLAERDWRIPAVVSHSQNGGIGVMFHEMQHQLLSALDLTAADSPSPLHSPQRSMAQTQPHHP